MFRISVFLVCILIALAGVDLAMAASTVYPGTAWARKPPAEVGMNPAKLKAFRKYVGGRGCVVRHGYMVYTWGNPARRADVASAHKVFNTHFLLKAIEKGKISSLDDRVNVVEPRLNDLNENLGYKDRKMTWRHMVNQISCYGVKEKPGEAFDYNDYQMALFHDMLFTKIYGVPWSSVDAKVLRPLLTNVLRCQDNPTMLAFGLNDRPGRVAISARDFARFGLLYLHKGNWAGRQLISARHAAMAVSTPLLNSIPRTEGKPADMVPGQRSNGGGGNQTDHFGSYSYLWWTNGVDRNGKRHWPDAPTDTYGAFGHGGIRAMIVIPSLDLIVSWNDTNTRGRDRENRALKLLVEAVVRP